MKEEIQKVLHLLVKIEWPAAFWHSHVGPHRAFDVYNVLSVCLIQMRRTEQKKNYTQFTTHGHTHTHTHPGLNSKTQTNIKIYFQMTHTAHVIESLHRTLFGKPIKKPIPNNRLK